MAEKTSTRSRAGQLGTAVALLVVAGNLRPAIASVSPLLTKIQASTGISSAEAGLLTTIPLIAFGGCALLAPLIGRRIGAEATIAGGLALLIGGIGLRSGPTAASLFIGTALLGLGVALANVLIPALVKRDFPGRVGPVTGLYSVALTGGAALAAGVAVPIVDAIGGSWRDGLALWAAPAAVCLVIWSRHLRDTHRVISTTKLTTWHWRDPLSWQVTIFFGTQSLGYYSMLAWLPADFEQHGIHAAVAGWLLSLAGFCQLPTAFAVALLARSPSRQRLALIAIIAMNAAALGGVLSSPAHSTAVWVILLGLAQGGAFGLALSFIVVRSPSFIGAAQLSAMAQTLGYLLASAGPATLGLLRDTSGGFTVPMVALVAVLAPELLCGLAAARPTAVGGELGGGTEVPEPV